MKSISDGPFNILGVRVKEIVRPKNLTQSMQMDKMFNLKSDERKKGSLTNNGNLHTQVFSPLRTPSKSNRTVSVIRILMDFKSF